MTIHRRALLAAAGLALPTLAFGQEAGPIRFKGFRGQEVDAERGVFEVPEDRRDPASRRIKLTYVRFRSTADRPGPPIIYLAGGPGGTATGTATGPRFPIFMALREVSDVIAFDQRGTGLSNHIPRRPRPAGPPPPFTRAGLTAHVRAEFVRAWADWTAAGVAMRGYNTNQSADDIDDLRQHLGAERIHLWGISYGSHLGLAVLKRHGERVDRVALASLEGLDQTVKRPARWDAYIRQIDQLLGADPEVRAAVPDLPALMRRVHARMEAQPLRMSVRLGAGEPTELQLGGFAAQMLAGSLAANPDTLARLPALYLGLEAGNTAAFAAYASQMGGVLGVTGMPEAMDLASGISPRRLAMVEREAKTAVIGDALNFPMPHLLGVVPDADLGPAFRAPFMIPHRALLVAGSLDGRTVLAEQAEVAAQFRDKTQVLVENAGHNVFEAHPQVQDLIVRFFKGEAVADTTLTLPPPKFRVA
ncbi:MAG: alpha/beta fold hydrolase [Phenylobacterium sp.]